jgi:hypothetical protein
MHTRHFYPGEITLTVGEPISTAGMTLRQVEELNTRLRESIERMRAASSAYHAQEVENPGLAS